MIMIPYCTVSSCLVGTVRTVPLRCAILLSLLLLNMDLRMEHAQLGLTIRIPPRTHRTCTLCKADYTVPLSDDPAKPQMRCLPCQKREKCSACRKIKKRRHFHKKKWDELDLQDLRCVS